MSSPPDSSFAPPHRRQPAARPPTAREPPEKSAAVKRLEQQLSAVRIELEEQARLYQDALAHIDRLEAEQREVSNQAQILEQANVRAALRIQELEEREQVAAISSVDRGWSDASSAGGISRPATLIGDMSELSLANVLSFLELQRISGRLRLVSQGRRATVDVRAGRIVDVTVDSSPGSRGDCLERLLRVLDWTAGTLTFYRVAAGGSAESAAGLSIAAALLEHARRRDEAARSHARQ